MKYETTPTESREWHYTDKAAWGDGDWQEEPDKVQWTDEETGLPCLVVRGPSGALCGYAGVPKSHPWFGKDYMECTLKTPCDERYCGHAPDCNLDAHGGITFADSCSPRKDNAELGICHVIPGDEKVWWFGFDCAHSGDVCPSHRTRDDWRAFEDYDSSYKPIGYVKAYATALAAQLASVEPTQ